MPEVSYGWKYLLDNINKELTLAFIKELHELVACFDVDYRYLGKIRQDKVLISGTKWRPDVPTSDDLDALNRKLKITDPTTITDRALSVGLYIMRWNDSKRIVPRSGSLIHSIVCNHLKMEINELARLPLTKY